MEWPQTMKKSLTFIDLFLSGTLWNNCAQFKMEDKSVWSVSKFISLDAVRWRKIPARQPNSTVKTVSEWRKTEIKVDAILSHLFVKETLLITCRCLVIWTLSGRLLSKIRDAVVLPSGRVQVPLMGHGAYFLGNPTDAVQVTKPNCIQLHHWRFCSLGPKHSSISLRDFLFCWCHPNLKPGAWRSSSSKGNPQPTSKQKPEGMPYQVSEVKSPGQIGTFTTIYLQWLMHRVLITWRRSC